jgi:PIN domain nuclease of toxin-antitoxin system
VRLLLDTHILLWAIAESRRLSAHARALIGDAGSEVTFSVVSLWEVAIKSGRGRDDFNVDASRLRRSLIDNGYVELAITGAHAAGLVSLPPIHRDPFDRMLVAQATVEGLTLLTIDTRIAQYPGPILLA